MAPPVNQDAARKVADEIGQEGGEAIAVAADCLDVQSLQKASEEVEKRLGTPDILINGAGGNHPRGTTDDEQLDPAAIGQVKTFFDLDPSGVQFVLNLNYMATLLTTQVFAKNMAGRGGNIINISSMNAFRPLTKIPAYSGAKAAVSNLTQWMAVYFAKAGVRAHRTHRQNSPGHPHGPLRGSGGTDRHAAVAFVRRGLRFCHRYGHPRRRWVLRLLGRVRSQSTFSQRKGCDNHAIRPLLWRL